MELDKAGLGSGESQKKMKKGDYIYELDCVAKNL